MKLPMDSTKLIPHRGKMKLIGDVIRYRTGMGTVEARLDSNSPFVSRTGEVETTVGVELIAQACAAVNGLDSAETDQPAGRGYLVSVDSGEFHSPIPADETLSVQAHRECRVGSFHIFTGQVYLRHNLLAEARVKVWAPTRADED